MTVELGDMQTGESSTMSYWRWSNGNVTHIRVQTAAEVNIFKSFKGFLNFGIHTICKSKNKANPILLESFYLQDLTCCARQRLSKDDWIIQGRISMRALNFRV